jgi:hypothetical protein
MRRPNWSPLLLHGCGQGAEQPGRLTEHTAHLGAAVGLVPLRQGRSPTCWIQTDHANAANAGVGACSTKDDSPATSPSCRIGAPARRSDRPVADSGGSGANGRLR